MSKILLAAVVAVTGILSTLGLTGVVGPSHAVKVGNPNFVCVAYKNVLGLCVGPPTTN